MDNGADKSKKLAAVFLPLLLLDREARGCALVLAVPDEFRGRGSFGLFARFFPAESLDIPEQVEKGCSE